MLAKIEGAQLKPEGQGTERPPGAATSARPRKWKRREGETHEQHARRLESYRRQHGELAKTAPSSAEREQHERAQTDLDQAIHEARSSSVQSEHDTPLHIPGFAETWGTSLALMGFAGGTLYLLFTGRLKAFGSALVTPQKPASAKKVSTTGHKKLGPK